MAEYTFFCKNCQKEFSIFEKMGKFIFERIECPECHEKNIVRIWNIPTIHYKGNGFTKGLKQ